MANFHTGATPHSVARSQHSTEYIQSLSAAAAARLGEEHLSRERQYFRWLAEQLPTKPVQFCWEKQHRFLAAFTIDRLITLEPDCPRWASQRVDQLTFLLEESW